MQRQTTHGGTAAATATTATLDAAVLARLGALEDQQELERLASRLGRWLDGGGADEREAQAILAEDVRVRTLGGAASGRDAVIAQARRTHAAHRTQHLVTNVLAEPEPDGSRARVEANLLVVFADADSEGLPDPRFALGERYALEAARADAGWRLTRIEIRPLWRIDR